jgi:hypothetical protein
MRGRAADEATLDNCPSQTSCTYMLGLALGCWRWLDYMPFKELPFGSLLALLPHNQMTGPNAPVLTLYISDPQSSLPSLPSLMNF